MANRSALGFLGIAVLIAGCAAEPSTEGLPFAPGPTAFMAPSIAEFEIQGGLPREAIVGEQPPFSPDSSYPFPTAGWLDGGDRFAIVLAGSSSCPAFPSSMEVLDPHTVKLGIDRHDETTCSADMAPRTHVINTPAGINRTQEVTLEYGDSAVTLPALQ